MIKAIIIDCFGVLVRDGWLHFKDQYFATNPDLWNRAGELNRQVDAGIISYDDFISEIALLAGVDKPELLNDLNNNVKNTELFEFIKTELKPKFELGILSNAAENWLDELLGEDMVKMFDQIVLSFEVGATKPDPKMYQTILERLKVSPAEAIFIDDQERYCISAEDLGIKSIFYKSNQQLFAELESLLQ